MRYNRTNFYDINIVNNIPECDLVMSNWNKFSITRPTTFYTIKQSDLKRPDLIAIKTLGRQELFWIIMKVNDVCDLQNDLTVGDVLQIPNLEDINDWQMLIRKSA
jgi:hypothetical protein